MYRERFDTAYHQGLCAKLGLTETQDEDVALATQWLRLLHRNKSDFTNSFRLLAEFDSQQDAPNHRLRDHFIDRTAFDGWAQDYRARLQASGNDDAKRKAGMNQVNPKYILRNYLAQTAIEKAQAGDFSEIERLQKILQNPYAEQVEYASYASPPPDWGRELEVSCSS